MSDLKELQGLNGKSEQREKNERIEQLLVNCSNQTAKWTKLLAFAGYASTIGTAVPSGYAIGVLNSPAVYMRQWCNESLIDRFDVSLTGESLDLLWSSIVTIFLIGGAIGALTGSWIANKFGRKSSTLICAGLFMIAGISFYSCRLLNSIELLLLGRLIVGLAAGLSVACLPMYLSEIAPLDLRGTLGVFCAVGTTAGVVVAQIITLGSVLGTAETWHIALSFYMILVVICFAPYYYYPESPKWLYVIKGDPKAAQFELSRLRSADEQQLIARELENMDIEANEPNQMSGLMDVFGDRKLTLPLILVCSLHGGQQLSGINAIFNYSVSIFRKAGLSAGASEWANLGAGSLNLTISLLGPILMAKFNRRPLMLFSSFFCCFALLGFAIMLHFIDVVSWFAMGCLVFIFVYIFFYQFGVGPIPYFIGAVKTKHRIVSPRAAAVDFPQPLSSANQIPNPAGGSSTQSKQISSSVNTTKTTTATSGSGHENPPYKEPYNQKELSDLIRDLNLNKDQSELLASRFKERG